MRKVIGFGFMIAAMVAGCGAEETGPGSGSGSGSGSGDPAGRFTLDSTPFVVTPDRWWAGTSGPELTGTVDSQGGTLIASIGGAQVGPAATIVGGTWSLQLPDGAIAPTDTTIALELAAPGKATVEHDQVFALDTGATTIAFSGSMHDERGDVLDFSTGVPVHTHDGPVIQLGGGGCPDVYKYAYLTATNRPYGSETAPNPLAWQVDASSPVGLDPAGAAYRVRAADGTVLLDWAALPDQGNGSYTIALHRDGGNAIPQLGTDEGQLTLDVRFRDTFGQEASASSCIVYHPLAAPLEISPLVRASTGESLWTMSLPADSPISDLLNSEAIQAPRVAVVGTRFVQYTADPITLDLSIGAQIAQWTKQVSTRFAQTATGSFNCGTQETYSSDPRCNTLTNVSPSDVTSTGSVVIAAWVLDLVDEATGLTAASCTIQGFDARCTVPARTGTSGPRAFHAVLRLGDVQGLWPAASDPFGENTVAGRTYTGVAPQPISKCVTRTTSVVNGVVEYHCTYATYAKVIALRQAQLAFPAFSASYQTSVGPHVALAPPPYFPPMSTGPLLWDAGTDVLPGE